MNLADTFISSLFPIFRSEAFSITHLFCLHVVFSYQFLAQIGLSMSRYSKYVKLRSFGSRKTLNDDLISVWQIYVQIFKKDI